ncbi:MAG TPA: DUF4037 domain-containing protein [Acidimicrobiales bacterium]|nr:DUF4037 domain-containing protein [Acidimicrobiales bacterium]
MNGAELCGAFYAEAVRPLLGDLRHSAGLLGSGSEVLGFDDQRSTDHHWGPRVMIFVDDADVGRAADIRDQLAAQLPKRFGPYSTHFTEPNLEDHGTQLLADTDGPVNHRVDILTVAAWSRIYLGFDATVAPTVTDWVATPSQLLAGVTSGPVYHDGLGELAPMQARLEWYPDDVWRYVLSAQWRRISQEDHFVGRTAEVGDDLGSRLLAGRLARDMIRLAFLIERRHAPYVKWLGSAFRQLALAADLGPALDDAVAASTFAEREAALARGYEVVMAATNALDLAPAPEPTVRPFFGRGFLVTMGERFADALHGSITDGDVLALPQHLGAVDQYVDSTDALSYPSVLRHIVR